MFCAIDKNTNEIILSLNVRDNNYKDTYNKELRYKCIDCDDNNVVFVNSKCKKFHFRHSSSKKYPKHKKYIEFNKDFYLNWYQLFKKEYRKPYWYNINLEEIRDENNIIMIRHSLQKSETIKSIEKYAKDKIIWILSLENRKYNYIDVYNGKIYIDFIASKNDIPLYDNNKSIVYLDTGTDILLKVLLNNYNSRYGQEIEYVNIYDLFNEYKHLFIAYPYRKKDIFYKNIMLKQTKFIEKDEYLLSEYYKAKNNYINTRTLENFYKINKIYNKLSILKPIEDYKDYKDEYDNILIKYINYIKENIFEINKIEKEIKEIKKYYIELLQKINKIICIYKSYFENIEILKTYYTDISYIDEILINQSFSFDGINIMIYNYEYYIKLEQNIINYF